jgi:hypothetical protein
MSDSLVIKEFLVKLGVVTDDTAMKKFKEGVTGVSSAVLKLGTVIEATALAVSIAVERWSSSLEQLYFTSRRTGESANQLTAYSRAMQDFGVSADEATGSVEGLASFMRNTYGGSNFVEGLLGSVGLSARDAQGKLLDLAGLMKQIGKMFQIMREQGNTPLANIYAQKLGISERSMLAMSSPGFEQDLAQKERLSKGLDAAALAAHNFQNAWRDLKQEMQQMMLPFEESALASLEKLMPKLSKLMHDHGKQIVDDLAALFAYFIDGIGKLFDFLDRHGKEWVVRLEALFLDLNFNFTMYIEPVFGWLYDTFVKLDKITGGWASKVAAVALALKALGASGIVTGVVSIGKALAGVVTTVGSWAIGGLTALSETTGALAVGATGLLGGLAVAAGGALGYGFDELFPNNPLAKMGHWIGGALSDAKDYADAAYKADQAMRGQDSYTDFMRNGGSGATVQNFHVTNDIKVSGVVDPHKVGGAIADATEDRLRRLQYSIVRDFGAVAQ